MNIQWAWIFNWFFSISIMKSCYGLNVTVNRFHEERKKILIKFYKRKHPNGDWCLTIAKKKNRRVETKTYAHLTAVQLIFHSHPIENSSYSFIFAPFYSIISGEREEKKHRCILFWRASFPLMQFLISRVHKCKRTLIRIFIRCSKMWF